MNHATHPVAWMASAVLLLCIAHDTLLPTRASAQIVINEFMASPGSGEPEWIELFNDSDRSVDITGWTLHDRGSARPKIPEVVLAPGGYLLVTRDTAALRSTRSVSAPILRVSLPALNNGGDDIVLIDGEGRSVDSVSYLSSWGVSSGLSLERVRPDGSGVDRENWGTSTDSTGATPGRRNSLSPLENDLAVGSMSYDTESRRLSMTVINAGRKDSPGGVLTIFEDVDDDRRGEVSEILSGRTISPIASGDSVIAEYLWSESLPITGRNAIAVISAERDDVRENDTAHLLLRPPFGAGGPVINEMMVDPEEDEPEWIELYNGEVHPVNLADWVIHDAGTARPEISSGILPPGSYATLTDDTAALRRLRPDLPGLLIELPLPTLNNGGDLIALRRPDGIAIDSLRYGASWGSGRGLSIERLDPDRPSNNSDNWRGTLDLSGGTPGRANSTDPSDTIPRNLAIRSADYDPVAELLSVTIFSEGTPAITEGVLSLSSTDRTEEIEVATPSGESLLEIAWGIPDGVEVDVVTIVVRSDPDERPEDDTLRLTIRAVAPPADVIISEFMALPLDDAPEWVELHNRSEGEIDVLDWRIVDAAGTTPPLPSASIAPGGHIVITTDTAALVNRFPLLAAESQRLLVESSLPSLNNGGDIIKVVDQLDRTIDSLRYGSTWLGQRGTSLERKRMTGDGLNSEAWAPSSATAGGTPGGGNAWRPVILDLALLEVRAVDDGDSIVARIVQRGEGAIGDVGVPESFTLRLGVDLDRDGSLDAGEEAASTTRTFPAPDDTLTTTLAWTRELRVEGEEAIVVIDLPGDERPENNVATLRLQSGPIDSGVVINELMIEPGGDEPEWVELYNRTEGRIDLTGWVLHDAGSARPEIPGGAIKPNGYIVLTSDSTALVTSRPVFGPVIEVSLPTLNNGGDLVALVAPSGRMVDSVRYRPSWIDRPESSLERRYPDGSSVDSSNWGSSIDGGGGTPGWENSIVPAAYDLRLESARFLPERSVVLVTIENVGRRPVANGDVRIYHDRNGDLRGEESELERVESIGTIEPGEVRRVEIDWGRPLQPEGESALAEVIFAEEERPDDNRLPFTPRAPLGRDSVVINEFLPAPESGGVEWIELLNTGSRPVDLDRWRLADAASSAMIDRTTLLGTEGYLILTSDTARLRSAFTIPDGARLIELPLPALNNGGDEITLSNAEDSTVDRLTYDSSWEIATARSLERRHPRLPAESPGSWEGSGDPEGGTPGRANSVVIPERDLAIDSIAYAPSLERMILMLRNRGLEAIEGGSLHLLVEEDAIEEIPLGPLAHDEAIILEIPPAIVLTDLPATLRVIVVAEGDQRRSNDTAFVEVYRRPADDGVIFTELMADPLPVDGESGAEYLELLNIGERILSLAGWSLVEGVDGVISLGESAPLLPPGAYGVIASDSTIYGRFPDLRDSARVLILNRSLGLNNGSDIVRLLNSSGETVDSLHYTEAWHVRRLRDTRGVALERVRYEGASDDSASWSSSVDPRGGTPHGENSRLLAPSTGEGILRLGSTIISPDADGHEDLLRIAWSLPTEGASITISLYDREGRIAARPLENRLLGGEGEIIWDGADREGRPLPIGPYLLHLEAWPLEGEEPIVVRQVVVVAGRL